MGVRRYGIPGAGLGLGGCVKARLGPREQRRFDARTAARRFSDRFRVPKASIAAVWGLRDFRAFAGGWGLPCSAGARCRQRCTPQSTSSGVRVLLRTTEPRVVGAWIGSDVVRADKGVLAVSKGLSREATTRPISRRLGASGLEG